MWGGAQGSWSGSSHGVYHIYWLIDTSCNVLIRCIVFSIDNPYSSTTLQLFESGVFHTTSCNSSHHGQDNFISAWNVLEWDKSDGSVGGGWARTLMAALNKFIHFTGEDCRAYSSWLLPLVQGSPWPAGLKVTQGISNGAEPCCRTNPKTRRVDRSIRAEFHRLLLHHAKK